MKIKQLVSAEAGWKAVFGEEDGGESQSRVIGWAIVSGRTDDELVGVIVDPGEPSRIVTASGAVSPGGGSFVRYRYTPPEPPPAPPPPQITPAAPATPDMTEQLAKGLFKRGRR